MGLPIKINFNPAPSVIMYVDINSCFATVEQQANPLLRNRPVAVAAYTTQNGCILAPSVQAKKLGIKTGMRVKDGRLLCPSLVVLPPDPDKYRAVHLALKKVLSSYTPQVSSRSIDEFVLDFTKTPGFERGLFNIGQEIKDRIRKEVGDYITVSIGIGPSHFIAKTASNLQKPDGLSEINKENYLEIYRNLKLTDLTGIATRNASRLNIAGIYTVLDFYQADVHLLQSAFKSIFSYYWYARLRGWEVDDREWDIKTFGHSYSLPKFLTEPEELAPLLSKLVEKVGYRMRRLNYQARGVHLGLLFKNGQYWHKSLSLDQPVFLSQDIYRTAYRLLSRSSRLPVRNLAVSCFDLSGRNNLQLGLFEDRFKKDNLVKAIDDINDRWGSFVITPATMASTGEAIKDSISFGNVRGLV